MGRLGKLGFGRPGISVGRPGVSRTAVGGFGNPGNNGKPGIPGEPEGKPAEGCGRPGNPGDTTGGVGIPGSLEGNPGTPGGKPVGGVCSRLCNPGTPGNPTDGVGGRLGNPGGNPDKPGFMMLGYIYIIEVTQQQKRRKEKTIWGGVSFLIKKSMEILHLYVPLAD